MGISIHVIGPNTLKLEIVSNIIFQKVDDPMVTKQILIVDDQENVAMILASSLLILKDCEVETVYSGQEAVEKCRERHFDLVVADYQLPDITGITIAKALQQISPETKVILVTALRDYMIGESVAEANIHSFLEKPFPLQKYLDVVKDALNNVT